MRRAANRHPRAPQPISNGWGGAMTSPVLLSYPSPTKLLVLVARVEKFGVGWGMGKELVMSPFPCVIGCWVAGLQPINSLKKSGAAPRKALLPPEKETDRGPPVFSRCSVGYAPGLGQCGQVNSKTLILGRRTFLIAPSHPQTWVGT